MILVTGASGHVGGRVADLLAERDYDLRLMTRTPDALSGRNRESVVQADYAEPDQLDAAFDGVDVAFLVSGYAEPGTRARLHKNAIDAAARAGVQHLVYLSFQGAAPDSHFPMSRDHYQTEQFLKESGVPYTALRDNLYLDLIPELFGPDGVVRGPAGDGTVAWVSREDVAQTVAAALANPAAHAGTYDVTGPEALSLADTADRLSSLLGTPLRYEEESVEEGRAWRRQLDVPEWEVETWLGSYRAIAAGELAAPSDTVERFTGQPPARLDDYFEEHPELLDPLRET
ncbi:MAG TPA: SDR family oxidoreductase [Salinibacter sp.]|nr:SDR family oxidoreductase [Salinibacter sp.]